MNLSARITVFTILFLFLSGTQIFGRIGSVYGIVEDYVSGEKLIAQVIFDLGYDKITKYSKSGGGYIINAPADTGYAMEVRCDGYESFKLTGINVSAGAFHNVPVKMKRLSPQVTSVTPKVIQADLSSVKGSVVINGRNLKHVYMVNLRNPDDNTQLNFRVTYKSNAKILATLPGDRAEPNSFNRNWKNGKSVINLVWKNNLKKYGVVRVPTILFYLHFGNPYNKTHSIAKRSPVPAQTTSPSFERPLSERPLLKTFKSIKLSIQTRNQSRLTMRSYYNLTWQYSGFLPREISYSKVDLKIVDTKLNKSIGYIFRGRAMSLNKYRWRAGYVGRNSLRAGREYKLELKIAGKSIVSSKKFILLNSFFR